MRTATIALVTLSALGSACASEVDPSASAADTGRGYDASIPIDVGAPPVPSADSGASQFSAMDSGSSGATPEGGAVGDSGVAAGDSGVVGDSGAPPGAADGGAAAPTSTFTLGGSMIGLHAGGSVTFLDNGGSPLTLTANGPFAFPTPVSSGSAYDVTVLTQPTAPAETCTVIGGTGVVGLASVKSVEVLCASEAFSVGGTVSGLAPGETVVLSLGTGSPLSVAANGSFTFPSLVASGSPYGVTVVTNPGSQACTVAGGSGTVVSADVASVTVTCACAPTTCAAKGLNCGSTPDGCGGTLACGTCAAGTSCGAGGEANVCAVCGTATGGTLLEPGQSLASCDGRFLLAMQATDGNLVLYMGGTALWSSATDPSPGAFAAMQTDGNFVVYSAGDTALWNSVTEGNSGAFLAVQDDGNLVVYSASASPLWDSQTGGH